MNREIDSVIREFAGAIWGAEFHLKGEGAGQPPRDLVKGIQTKLAPEFPACAARIGDWDRLLIADTSKASNSTVAAEFDRLQELVEEKIEVNILQLMAAGRICGSTGVSHVLRDKTPAQNILFGVSLFRKGRQSIWRIKIYGRQVTLEGEPLDGDIFCKCEFQAQADLALSEVQ